MTTKLQKLSQNLNNQFAAKLDELFKAKFDVEIKTGYNIFSMRLVSARKDGLKFTKAQKDFLDAFTTGWVAAADYVYAEANK